MTMQELKQYRLLKKEIDHINHRITQLNKNPLSIVSDTVSASTHEAPYIPHSVTVRGLGNAQRRTVAQLNRKLNIRMGDALKEVIRIENFIATVVDANIRLIIHLRFIDCMSWTDVTGAVYKQAHASTARKALERYLATNQKKCTPCPKSTML